MRNVFLGTRVSLLGLAVIFGAIGFARADSATILAPPSANIVLAAGGQTSSSPSSHNPDKVAVTPPAPDSRIILTPEADYAGFDYNTLKGVDLQGCQKACLADGQCRAFTFNNKAGWCFLKSDFGALSATAGATAGRVVSSPEFTPSLEKQRLSELDFISSTLIDEARELAGTMKRFYNPEDGSYAALREAGGVAHRAGNYDEAATDFGKALAIADDNPGLWLDFAIANIGRKPENWSDRQRVYTNISAAAINAYIRSNDDANRAEALSLIGTGFEDREIWKPAYRAYRASLKLRPDTGIQSAYDKVIAEHGFRILSHEVDADSPTPRVCLVFSDQLPVTKPGLADFVQVEGEGLSVEPADRQICIDGVKHGGRYHIRIRGGLPSLDGEVLDRPSEIDVYVRDRAPWVGFAGNAYVLPAGKGASIPMISVNTEVASAKVYRIGDRGLAGQLRDGQFLKQLDNYNADNIADQSGELIWQGEVVIQGKLNENVTTAIPIADTVPTMKPGVYVITAQAKDAKSNSEDDYYGNIATQWFVVSDLGLTSLSANDGIHAIVRSLATAKAVPGVKIRLVASNDDILGEGITDADGHVRFDPGLGRGTGGAAPRLIDAQSDGDYAFLDLSRSAFDLSDRGVDGRASPLPLDVFMTPERGIYRPGETMHLTALVRDPRATAVTGLPMTLIVERPDGVEFTRKTLADAGAGGYSADIDFQPNAMRGSWTARLYADPKGDSLAETTILVEDFEPERLAFEPTTESKFISPSEPATIDIAARYLYGAVAPGLSVAGDIEVKPSTTIDGFNGYQFGLEDESVEPVREPLDLGEAVTDDDGKAEFDVALPQLPNSTRPFTAKMIFRLTDTNGRAVERNLTLPVKTTSAHVGIKPLFEYGEVDENSSPKFEVILVGPDGDRIAGTGLAWKLERVEHDYQWYNSNGNWQYENITTTRRVDSGTLDVGTDQPATVSSKVDYGSFRLTVETAGDDATATSANFYAGWYTGDATSETPDVLRVSLDKPAYRIGETAKLRLEPRFAGTALVTVMDDRLIAMKAVEVPAEGTTVDLEVTDQWGPGAYVTASLYRPMDVEAKRMPARALGLAWAKVAPGERQLNVSLGLPDEMRPRGPMGIPIEIGNLKPGTDAFVTVAAVDVGILNLTSFKTPDPDGFYFGQRKLGVEIRDLYGLLIDRMQGVPGAVRSGGDSGAVRLSAPPPTEKLVAFYSGIVKVGPDGKANVSFDIPDFNGTIRVMAMAWSAGSVGHAAKDVIVRDPVVVTASIPRFLSVGDKSRLLVEINNVAGPAGDYELTVETGDGVGIDAADQHRSIKLAEKQRLAFNMPIEGKAIGDFEVSVNLATPGGDQFPKTVMLGVRPAGEPITTRNIVAVSGGGKITIDANTLAQYVPGTTSVALSVGGASRLDVAGILSALDRYPYGCAEQTTSKALPLVYLDDVAITIGIASDKEVHERVQQAIERVLADQDSSGSFGLWGPYDTGNLWLDAYVTDFLTRAAEKKYDVPKIAQEIALDNLSNRVNYAQDFTNGGEDIAYALYVLARAGRAAIGDLRYYAETKIDSFRTPLAKAQIGAALALYGDRIRARNAFASAMADLGPTAHDNYAIWRSDYGTVLRDNAAVLTLAAESDTETVDLRRLAQRIADIEERRNYTSTQENAWIMLAAAALIRDAQKTNFSVDGATVAGPLFKRYSGVRLASSPVVVENLGKDALDAVVATTGIPATPEPAGGEGFKIERTYYTVDGEQTDIATVAQNDRIVVEVTVTATEDRGGQVLIVDPIPAGYEIENPDISASGDTTMFDWLDVERNAHTEARTDRFVAALSRSDGAPLQYSVAYSMRAVSPGVYAAPGAVVEDMYRPGLSAWTDASTVEVVGPTK